MQRIYDTLVGLSFLAFLAVGSWTGSVWQMAMILMALLGVMVWSSWMGGYIMGTERHRRAMRRRRIANKRVTTNPCYYCLSSQDDCQDTCADYQSYLNYLDQYYAETRKDGQNGHCKTRKCGHAAQGRIS